MRQANEIIKGRGAQLTTDNRFLAQRYDNSSSEGLDEAWAPDPKTIIFKETPKKFINKVLSPDVPADYSANPYQGCEHGCVYCYARNTHPYWGFGAGLDFERKVIVKMNAADLLEKEINHPSYQVSPIMFSGNTDCYQPVERKLEITRKCLEVFLKYKHPVSLITKSSLITRDLDILSELARYNLVHVNISVTTLDVHLKNKLEPRTASPGKRIETIGKLSEVGVPVSVLAAPMIPGLNFHEADQIVKEAAEVGALSAGSILIRLNGDIEKIFSHWVKLHFPTRAEKVLRQIKEMHGGSLQDTQFGRRMRGTGPMAQAIHDIVKMAKKKYMAGRELPPYNLDAFRKKSDAQLSLFG
ncbi:MAG: PA0069 family radical SAM protein [Bacteroidota bacterium]